MILDVLDNAHIYPKLNTRFAKSFEFLLRPDIKELPDEKYVIDGDRVFAIVSRGPGREKDGSLLETHEKYIDIQLVLAGLDEMGWKSKSSCKKPSIEYDQEKDIQLFKDTPDTWLSCTSNTFAIFFPEDAHMPMISSGEIHKIIVKVAVE